MKKLILAIVVFVTLITACGSSAAQGVQPGQVEVTPTPGRALVPVQRQDFELEEQQQPKVSAKEAETRPKPTAVKPNVAVGPQVGMRAPGLDGQLSFLVGKPAVINFWASWCGPCRQEEGLFHQAYNQHKEINFLGVSDTPGDKRFEAEFIPVLEDDGSSTLFQQYLVLGMPTTFFIGSDGLIIKKVVGPFVTGAELEKEIERLK